MTNKESIIKTIGFIEKNLKSDIGVMDIAREGCYSLYHFIRLFQNITGISPNKYLLQRRLTEAAYELQNTENKIADIAYSYQFSSHEGFTRAFNKYLGINPSQLRKKYPFTSLPLTHAITEDYIYQSGKIRNQPPVLLELEERILAGISFFISNDNEINDLSKEWGQFMSEVPSIKNKVLPERFYQVQFWSETQDLNGLYFYLGMEVTTMKGVDPQFVIKLLPKGHYLRFIHKGLANKVGYTYRFIYNQFLPETDYRLTKPFNFEYYGEKCLGPYNEKSESEIYIPVEISDN
ncbi:MAG: AraC family transcriptional regulator [Bacteroidales bacterium]|nr:AraC family transcriptional regulator [Bacteroidales bacterium]